MYNFFAVVLISLEVSRYYSFGRAEENSSLSEFEWVLEEEAGFSTSEVDAEVHVSPQKIIIGDGYSLAESDEEDLINEFVMACSEGDIDWIAQEIKTMPDLVNALDIYGRSCLMMAGVPTHEEGVEDDDSYEHKEPLDLVKMIVDAGGDINKRADDNHSRMPVLAFHVTKYNYKTVEYLIEKGADVNAEFYAYTDDGEMSEIFTSLDLYATLYEKGDAMSMYSDHLQDAIKKTKDALLSNGAKRYARNDDTSEGFSYAGIGVGGNVSFMNTLLDEDFLPPEFWDEDRVFQFFEACAYGDLEQIAIGLESMPELVNELDEYGQSCLMMAGVPNNEDEDMGDSTTIYKYTEPLAVVEMITEAGGDVNLRADHYNFRMPVIAFHVASYNYKTIQYLIDKGADVNAEFDGYTKDGEPDGIFTPLDLYIFLESEIESDNIDTYGNDDGLKEAIVKTKEVLQKNGARRSVNSDEL